MQQMLVNVAAIFGVVTVLGVTAVLALDHRATKRRRRAHRAPSLRRSPALALRQASRPVLRVLRGSLAGLRVLRAVLYGDGLYQPLSGDEIRRQLAPTSAGPSGIKVHE